MSRVSTFCLASSLSAVALLAAAPGAQAAPSKAWNAVSLSATVHGQSVSVTTSSRGVQHYLSVKGGPGAPFADPRSAGFNVDYGDGTAPDRVNGLGDSSCTTGPKTAPFADAASTYVHHYAKPGVYVITASDYYCSDSGEAAVVHKTVVRVGAGSMTKPAQAPVATRPTTPVPTTSLPTRGTPAKVAPAPAAAAPANGPKVNTDQIAERAAAETPEKVLAGVTVLGAFGGGAVLLRRRRTTN